MHSFKDFLSLFFYWLFYLFIFQMLSSFLVSLLQTPYPIPLCLAAMRLLPHSPSHSCLTSSISLYNGSSSLYRIKGLLSHGKQKRETPTRDRKPLENCWGQHTMTGTACSRPGWRHLSSAWQLFVKNSCSHFS